MSQQQQKSFGEKLKATRRVFAMLGAGAIKSSVGLEGFSWRYVSHI